jgi:hypothetical protein
MARVAFAAVVALLATIVVTQAFQAALRPFAQVVTTLQQGGQE